MNKKVDLTEKEISKIYKIHKYWSRKPWKPIANCIKRFSKAGDLVVDLFLGSGVTCLESINQNRNFMGYDLNPMAIFISENTVNQNFNKDQFIEEREKIQKKLEPFFRELYSSKDICPKCGANLIINHLNIGPKYKNKEEGIFFCENCGKKESLLKRKLNIIDLEQIERDYKITKWIPKSEFPSKFYKDRFSYKGIKKVTDFYTKRNVYALSELLHIIKNSDLKYKNLFLIAFSNTLLHASRLKSENVRPLNVNNYWIPDDYMEENVWLRFLERLNLVLNSKIYLKERFASAKSIGWYKIYNQSSIKTNLREGEVDYIITDPPYGDTIQYSELSFIWNSWLEKEFNTKEEIIINPIQKKGVSEYIGLLESSIIEVKRILRKGGKITFCFHNKDMTIWREVLNLFKKYEFNLEDVEVFSTLKNSYNNNWAEFSPKSDMYITFENSPIKNINISQPVPFAELIKLELKNNPQKNVSQIYDSVISNFIKSSYSLNTYDENIKTNIKDLKEVMYNLQNGNR